jgi:hypothetical protein
MCMCVCVCVLGLTGVHDECPLPSHDHCMQTLLGTFLRVHTHTYLQSCMFWASLVCMMSALFRLVHKKVTACRCCCVCLCIYIYVHVHVYIYIYIYIHTHTHINTYIHTCIHAGPTYGSPPCYVSMLPADIPRKRHSLQITHTYIHTYMYTCIHAGPTYGSPPCYLSMLPDNKSGKRYSVYNTPEKVVGLIKLPLDGMYIHACVFVCVCVCVLHIHIYTGESCRFD